MADKDNKMEKSIKEAIGKSLNEFNKKIGMAKIIKDNKNQDRILKGILSQVNDENTEKTEKSNVITLDNSTDGIVELKEIKGDTNVNVSKMEKEIPITHVIDDKYGNVISLDGITEGTINIDDIEGNTMVNCCKDTDKELTLNGDIDTSGYNNVTLTEGTDGGKVDIALEGNTMVNVCDQEDPVAITKNYEVTTGNHITLQGEYDGKCRPNIYGNTLVNLWDVKSSEISGQVVKTDTTIKIKTTDNIYSNFFMRDKKMFKPSTEYTFIINVIKNTLVDDSTIRITSIADGTNRDIFNNSYGIQGGKTGIFVAKLTTIADFSQANFGVRSFFNNPSQTPNCEAELNIIILEGDYTNKPIPEYFTGMQSSFEDKLITDEKDAHNGKYKVDYKVTGKNKCPRCITTSTSGNGITLTYDVTTQTFSYSGTATNTSIFLSIPCPNLKLLKDKSYIFSVDNPLTNFSLQATELGVGYNCNLPPGQSATPIVNLDKFTSNSIILYSQNLTIGQSYSGTFKIQIEEGTKATTYEPYKEYTKTLYLNSPLLEGDTIEQSGNDIVHMHRYNKVVLDGSEDEILESISNDKGIIRQGFSIEKNNLPLSKFVANDKIGNFYCDKLNTTSFSAIYVDTVEGICLWCSANNTQQTFAIYKGFKSVQEFRTWLQQNPLTIVYKLQTPTREVISTNDNLLLDSYVNGHLDVDTIVPIDKVVFQSYGTSLKYLSPNTEYTIQFESDSNGKLDALALNSSDVIGNLNIVKGINKFNITTSDKITINYLWTTGIGFNMSKIVVTPKVDGDFGYFKGMKSVGECEDLEIISNNNDNTLSNKQTMTHEPLRGLPNGVRDKYAMIDGKWYIERNCKQVNMSELDFAGDTNDTIKVLLFDNSKPMAISNIYSNSKTYDSLTKGQMFIQERGNELAYIWIPTDTMSNEEFKKFLNEKNATIVFAKSKPTYEPIEYNPFEVYTDITHISNNSTIPCNMVIKNSGYNCILKPSTKYTVALDTNKSGTIGINLGGTKGTTSNNVTTITTPATLTDNTLRLYGKGIKASGVRLLEGDKTNWIPSHFEGMKSCFEDKLQDDGKYKMEILSRNSDESLSNKIQFLLNEPLRAVGNVKDKVYVKEDKIIVQRNCGSVTFDGSDTWNLNKIENNIYTYSIRSTKFLTKMKVGTWETLMNNKCYIIDKCGTATTSTPKNEQLLIHNTVEDKFIWYSTPLFLTVQSVKQYLNDNPFKILYQLETPVYEEIEYSNNRLTLNSYDNSTLFYDTNIPVSNTSFKPLWEELVYVKNSTTYYIQFNAVGNGDVVVNLGGTELSTTITEGYNKIEITTPNNSTNLLTIDGQGIKISKVIVSEALCSGYYKGLQSCFEEHMENGKYVCVVRGISLDGNKVNGIKFYLNEPLRGVGDIKDRLCIKDNKLMVERNCGSITLDGSETWYTSTQWIPSLHFWCRVEGKGTNMGILLCDKNNEFYGDGYYWTNNILFKNDASKFNDVNEFKTWLQTNQPKIVYKLETPIYEEITNEYGLPIILEGYENGIVYVDSAVTPTTSIKYTSNNTVPTTLSNVDNLNTTTQDDINNNIVTYMMDIDMMLTEMEMEDNASIMSLSDSNDDNNQKHNPRHNNILDRMNEEDRIKYQDNTTKMLEKVIKGKSLTNEENINRIDLYLSEGKIREEQSNYLKELLKGSE